MKLFLWMPTFLGLLAAAGCGVSPASKPLQEDSMAIQISSSAFVDGGPIPKKYTCDAENVSPPLTWQGAPASTRSFALIADDPDAPVGIWVHWVMYNIPANVIELPEGAGNRATDASAGVQGVNDFRKMGYGGPCPPRGKPHRYFFKLYALDGMLDLKPGASKADLEKAMQGHILATGQIIGTYGR
jgi:Raf kinase inhibitor-like YbhB/YbcL family protein